MFIYKEVLKLVVKKIVVVNVSDSVDGDDILVSVDGDVDDSRIDFCKIRSKSCKDME